MQQRQEHMEKCSPTKPHLNCASNHKSASNLNQPDCKIKKTVNEGSAMKLVDTQPHSTQKQIDVVKNTCRKDIYDEEFAMIEQVVIQGDLSKLNPQQRVTYYRKVCESAGLNPFTNPFAYIILNGKLTLYAKKDCTEQLRKINSVSIEGLEDKMVDDLYIVKAKAKDKTGRMDESTGAVFLGGLKGEAKANAIMKAETKAKRRVTLSICGMGWTDESEVDSIPNAIRVEVDLSTGEIKDQHVAAIVPKVESQKPKITLEQSLEIKTILDNCGKNYKDWVYEHLKNQYQVSDLTELPIDLYPKVKGAAIKNMESYRKNQRLAESVETESLVEQVS